MFAAWAYWMTHGHAWKPGTVTAMLIGGFGAMAAYDGLTVAVREHARASDGRVVAGIVLEKTSPADDDPPRTRAGRRSRLYRNLTTEGTRIHDVLGRLILTGSSTAWIVEYRYPCGGPYGCRGKDFVPETLWRRLHVGESADVRLSQNGTEPRLAENPSWATVTVNFGIAGALLLMAGLVSGRVTATRRRYVTAPAVVTAVEPVEYLGAKRWRIRFAYLDKDGAAQESADEIATGAWKPGDDCLAVFSPDRPDLATFRPVQTA
jgi:hypothetical protein